MRVTSTLFHCSFLGLANLTGEGSFRQHVPCSSYSCQLKPQGTFEHGFLSQITITTGEVSSEAESKVEAVEIILGEKKMAAITSKIILQSISEQK